MRREKDEQRALEEKLAAMQAKVVRGGTNLLDQEQRLLEEARRREEKLAKIAAAEAEQARRIKELEDLNTITGDKYKTIEEEIESKARKIHKLHEAYQRCVVDLKDLDLEFERERENLLDTVRALTRQIKLKNLVLDSYVPPDELRKITDFATWDDRSETWRVDRAQHAGNPSRARRLAADAKRAAEGGAVNERVVAALAEAYGDFEKAREAAGKSDAARLQSAYYSYGGSSSSAGAEHGEGAEGVPRGKSAKASRPGSARGGKRTRPASAAARRGRDEDARARRSEVANQKRPRRTTRPSPSREDSCGETRSDARVRNSAPTAADSCAAYLVFRVKASSFAARVRTRPPRAT